MIRIRVEDVFNPPNHDRDIIYYLHDENISLEDFYIEPGSNPLNPILYDVENDRCFLFEKNIAIGCRVLLKIDGNNWIYQGKQLSELEVEELRPKIREFRLGRLAQSWD